MILKKMHEKRGCWKSTLIRALIQLFLPSLFYSSCFSPSVACICTCTLCLLLCFLLLCFCSTPSLSARLLIPRPTALTSLSFPIKPPMLPGFANHVRHLGHVYAILFCLASLIIPVDFAISQGLGHPPSPCSRLTRSHQLKTSQNPQPQTS